MEIIRTGLAAFGMSGQLFHAPFISTNPHFELTAIVEHSKNIAADYYPLARVVRTLDEMIAMEDIDLVVVNTPDSTHYDYAKKALMAGKNVVVEKPITTTLAQLDELIAIADERGLMLSAYQNRRYDSDFLTVKEVIAKGVLGRLVEFESTFPRYRREINHASWKETGVQGGGLTYNLGSHLIDQAVQLFGIPEAIYSDTAILRDGGFVDDYFMIHFIRPSKMPELRVTLKSSYLMCESEPRFVLHGTDGSFVKYGLDPQEASLKEDILPVGSTWGEEDESIWGTLHTNKKGIDKIEKYPSCRGNYGLFYDDICQHLLYARKLESDARNVRTVIDIIEKAYKGGIQQIGAK